MSLSDVNDGMRLYWQFKVYGEDNIAVLNGGTAGWIAAGREVSTAAVTPAAGNWSGILIGMLTPCTASVNMSGHLEAYNKALILSSDTFCIHPCL